MASNTEIDWSGLPDAQAGGGSAIDFSGLPDAGDPSLAGVRSPYADELSDPKTAGKLYALTHREVGSQGPEAQQAFVETVFNRAAARNMTLGQTISDPNYYPAASLRRAALSPDDVTRYQQMAVNAAQGSNISGLATGNASGTVGFAGGPQTYKAGGERFGIEGPDRGWAQNFEQAQRGVPVQQQDVYTRVEKAVPVNVQEHEVARAYPVKGSRPPMPTGPDTLNAPPLPTIDWSGLPDAGQPSGIPPASLAAPEGTFPKAEALVPPELTSIQGPKQIAPTPTGVLPAQTPNIFASPEAYGQSLGVDEAGLVKQFAETPVGQQAEKAAGTVVKMVKSELRWPTAEEIASRLIPGMGPYGLAQIKGLAAAFEGKPAEHVLRTAIPEYNLIAQAREHEVGSQEWWDAVIPLGIEGAGFLLGAAGLRGAKAPSKGMVPGEAPAAAGEAGAAAPAGEAAAAGVARPKFANVAEELRWLAKNDPAEFQRRFAEEQAKRQQAEYEVKQDTEPVSPAAAGPEPPPAKPAQPTAAAPAPEEPVTARTVVPGEPAPAPDVPTTIEAEWTKVPTESRLTLTDELAARGHSPEHIAGLSPVQAAGLLLQPAPNEPAPTQAPAFPPPAQGEQAGSAWHGVPFLSADPIKADLISLGYEPDAIDAMTRSQLTAAMPVIEAARQQAPAAAPAPAAAGPAIDLSGLPDHEAATPAPTAPTYQPGDTIEYQSPSGQWLPAKIFKGQNKLTGQPQEPVVTVGGSQFADGQPRTFVKTTLPAPHDLIPIGSVRPAAAAPLAAKIGDLIAFKMPAVVKGMAGTMRAAGTILRALPNGKLEVRLQQGGYHQIDPSEIIPKAAQVRPAKPLTKAQKIAQDEARKEMEAAGQEAIAAQGGMDLIEAVTKEGGLPLKGTERAHHYRGELKMLRETIRGTKGVRYRDIFGGKSRGVDDLLLRLRARGFNIETPHQLIEAIEHRIRTGIPHYGLPEAAQAMHGPPRVGETPEVVAPTPPPYAPPVPAANTVKLAEDIQTFLDFNKVPPARKPQATEEIKNTLALAGDPALQAFYQGGGFGIPGPQLAAALRANKNRVSIIYHDLISRQIPTWNIEGSIIANAADFAMAVGPIRSPDFESFKVVARDPVTKRVLGAEITSVGTVDQAILNPRDVFRLFARIKEKHPNAEIIVSHNHPSGKPKPSDPDKNVQRRLHEGAAAAGVKLADHIITNGKEYFSFEQEELTGNGYGTLPNPVLQPWEVVRQEESPAIRSPDDLAKFSGTLRADDPNAVHIFYTGTQSNVKALERVSQGTNLATLKAAVSNGIARESAFGVLLDFARVPPANVITSLVNMVHDAMGAKFLDASWPGMDSVRAAGSHGLRPLHQDETGYITEHGGAGYLQRGETGTVADVAAEAGAGGVSGQPPQVPQLQPLSQMERTKLETLRRNKATLTPAGKRQLAKLEAQLISQGDLLASNDVFNLSGEQQVDWAARQAQAEAAEAVRVAAQQAAEKAQMSLFENPSMPYVAGTARMNESNGGGSPPRGPQGASMFSGNTPPRSNPQPIWAKRYANKMRAWWHNMVPRSYEIARKVPESPVISEHQLLMERELEYVNNFTKQPWWQTLRRRPEEEIVNLEHQAVMTYRRLLAQGAPRDAAWAQAVAQVPPDLQALFQHREGRVPTERWAAGQLAVDEPSYTGDPYIARLTNEEGKAVVDLHPQTPNWGRHIRQSIGSFDKSRVHASMKEGIQAGVQYEPPTLAAFVRELYSARLVNTARMLKRLKQEGVLFDDKAEAIAAGRALHKSAGPVTLVRGFGGKDYWARTRVEAQFLQQNLNTTNSSGAVGKLVRVANAVARNPNLMFNPLPHATKNMAFKYALARIGNFTLGKSAREFGTNAQMRARFEAVMPMPATGVRLPQLRALEAGTYLERIVSKGAKWISGNHFSARFNFAMADPALRFALWKTYVRKGLTDQAAANHVWVDLIRYDENSGALNFWRGIPFNFFATWRLGTYISLAKQLRNHPIRALLFIGAVEYLREILYRKYGWWTHLPVDYVDAPLAEAIEDPKTIPGVAATTLLFGPGGGQAPHTIGDVMKAIHGDPGQTARVMNMFWGLSQLYNMPQEFNAYLKDKDPKHLALLLQNAAFSTHSALKYNPHRLMQWLPEWMPGLEKSAIVRRAEGLQAKIEAKTEKARATYEARHGIGPTLEYRTEEGQMRALERAAGEHPPKPGPPKRTRVLPSPRSSGKPRGFGLVQPDTTLDYVA